MSVQTRFLASCANDSTVGTVDWTISGQAATIHRSTGTGVDNSIKIVKAGIIVGDEKSLTASWPTTPTNVGFGASNYLWNQTWTVAQINTSGFGVAISATIGAITTHYAKYTAGANPFSLPAGTINGIVATFNEYSNNSQSFVAGTLVQTPTGTVPIESLNSGDNIISHDTNGVNSIDEIITTHSSERNNLMSITTPNRSIICTTTHAFLTEYGYQEAWSIKTGTKVFVYDLSGQILEEVSAIELIERNEMVYTLSVKNNHTFYAGGFAVHNMPAGLGTDTTINYVKVDVFYTEDTPTTPPANTRPYSLFLKEFMERK